MFISKYMTLIVAVSGKLGSGKDYIMEHYLLPILKAQGLCNNATRMAFADHVKINVASRCDIDIEKCLSGNKSPELRRMLQIEGTEHGRDKYGENIWVNTMENWVKLRSIRDNIDVVLITDCRFPNEAKWIQSKGGLLIRVNAPKRNSLRLDYESGLDKVARNNIESHRSETALDDYNFTHIVDNDPEHIDTVRNQVIQCIKKWKQEK